MQGEDQVNRTASPLAFALLSWKCSTVAAAPTDLRGGPGATRMNSTKLQRASSHWSL